MTEFGRASEENEVKTVYRVVPSESMCCLPVFPLPVSSREQAERCPERWLAFWILPIVLLAFLLGGCSSKQISGKREPLLVTTESPQEEQTGTVYLPSDDGIILSPAEERAWNSSGLMERNLSSADMRDVMLHFKYLVHKDRYTVEKNLDRSRLYLPYILRMLRERNMPEELAFIPFIESGYNPLAVSRSGAAGMWQFIPSTGRIYGLQQDWWMDERRDPYQATRAAIDYLEKLYGMFGSWPLAITAYNAGEGKISRALAASGARDFFELRRRNDRIYSQRDRLLEENKQYFPKFLAVCKIMRNLDSLGFQPLPRSGSGDIVKLSARPGTDLKKLAQAAGMSWESFFAHNPAYLRSVTHPGRYTSVYVPGYAAAEARRLLVQQHIVLSGWQRYSVRKGETMTSISRRTGIPVAELRRLNDSAREPLRAGSVLRIPDMGRSYEAPVVAETVRPEKKASSTGRGGGQAVASRSDSGRGDPVQTASSGGRHVVQSGDTLFSLSRQYGVEQEHLMASNGLSSHSLSVGQQLSIPGKGRTTTSPSAATASLPPRTASDSAQSSRAASRGDLARPKTEPSAAAPSGTDVYTVQPGDTLWAIARKFDIPPTQLLALNNMTRESRLKPGDHVRVRK